MKMKDYNRIAEVMKIIKKKIIPDEIRIDDYSGSIDDYSGSIELHLTFKKEEE